MKRGEIALMLVVGGIIAWLAPAPWWETDRDIYERMAREWVVKGCNDFHCFRPLVPWVLGRLPGPPIVIWKAYAVVCETAAAVAMSWWAMRWGVSRDSARMVGWMTAFGSGAAYTLFDPYSSDALMHLLGPALMLAIDRGHFAGATAVSAVGVFGKEFAALPLAISAATRGIQQRWPEMKRLTIAAVLVIAIWAGWQIFARTEWHYITGPTYSADLTNGGYVAFWMITLSTTLVLTLIAFVFGGLWLLWPAGLWWGPRELRQVTLASMPGLLVLNSLQQPDRALWNFGFLAMPAAAVVLDRVPAAWGWTLVGLQVLINLRFGAQLLALPPARLTLTAAVILAAAIVWRARTHQAAGVQLDEEASTT